MIWFYIQYNLKMKLISLEKSVDHEYRGPSKYVNTKSRPFNCLYTLRLRCEKGQRQSNNLVRNHMAIGPGLLAN